MVGRSRHSRGTNLRARLVQPAVTVVIPTRNRFLFLAEAIESVRQQTSGDWEIVVVDDASDDGSAAEARNLLAEDGRMRLVVLEEHAERSRARNTGLAGAFRALRALSRRRRSPAADRARDARVRSRCRSARRRLRSALGAPSTPMGRRAVLPTRDFGCARSSSRSCCWAGCRPGSRFPANACCGRNSCALRAAGTRPWSRRRIKSCCCD